MRLCLILSLVKLWITAPRRERSRVREGNDLDVLTPWAVTGSIGRSHVYGTMGEGVTADSHWRCFRNSMSEDVLLPGVGSMWRSEVGGNHVYTTVFPHVMWFTPARRAQHNTYTALATVFKRCLSGFILDVCLSLQQLSNIAILQNRTERGSRPRNLENQ